MNDKKKTTKKDDGVGRNRERVEEDERDFSLENLGRVLADGAGKEFGLSRYPAPDPPGGAFWGWMPWGNSIFLRDVDAGAVDVYALAVVVGR